jgi:conjugative relaxase-like TrwC/TraI family protein
VSLLWAFATPETSSLVSIAHVEAVIAALEVLEQRAAVTRQQKQGVRRQVPTSGLAVATFAHRTSREGDPQLHTHCVIPNLVHRPDGSYVAIDAAGLFRWAKAAGSIYQEELRRRLSERLGVGWGPGSQRHPRDARVHRGAAGDVLQAGRADPRTLSGYGR